MRLDSPVVGSVPLRNHWSQAMDDVEPVVQRSRKRRKRISHKLLPDVDDLELLDSTKMPSHLGSDFAVTHSSDFDACDRAPISSNLDKWTSMTFLLTCLRSLFFAVGSIGMCRLFPSGHQTICKF